MKKLLIVLLSTSCLAAQLPEEKKPSRFMQLLPTALVTAVSAYATKYCLNKSCALENLAYENLRNHPTYVKCRNGDHNSQYHAFNTLTQTEKEQYKDVLNQGGHLNWSRGYFAACGVAAAVTVISGYKLIKQAMSQRSAQASAQLDTGAMKDTEDEASIGCPINYLHNDEQN